MRLQPKTKKIPSIWDYDVSSIDLSKSAIVKWYLKRRIDYCDWKGMEYHLLKKYLPKLDIDLTIKEILMEFVKNYEKGNIK
ncbi:MAG: hypothetical protein ABH881_00775 [bacterium]